LVLPFVGAEMFVLFLAFRFIERHAGDFESIAIKGDRVLVERWGTGRVRAVPSSTATGRRWWCSLPAGPGKTTLALRSHGREMEFGQHLTQDQKDALARTLRQQVSTGP
jgi:uncharacterized membrane protein